MIKCLVENPEFAATSNGALEHYSGLTSCGGQTIAGRIEEEILASCGSGDAGAQAANELVGSLQESSWLDLLELENDCPCMFDVISTQMLGNKGMCNSLGVFEAENHSGNLRFTYGVPSGTTHATNFFDLRPVQPAQTAYDFLGNTIVAINPRMYDGSFGEGAPRIEWNNFTYALIPVHEGYHAQLYSYILVQGITFNNAGQIRFYELQNALLGHIGCGPSNDQQHTYFLRDLLFEFAGYLREADGNRYDLDYYVWFAGSDLFLRNGQGTGANSFNPCAVEFYGQSVIETWRTNAEYVLNQPVDRNGDGQFEQNDLLLPNSCNQ